MKLERELTLCAEFHHGWEVCRHNKHQAFFHFPITTPIKRAENLSYQKWISIYKMFPWFFSRYFLSLLRSWPSQRKLLKCSESVNIWTKSFSLIFTDVVEILKANYDRLEGSITRFANYCHFAFQHLLIEINLHLQMHTHFTYEKNTLRRQV